MNRVELRDALIASFVIATMATLVVTIFSLIGQEGGEWVLFDSLVLILFLFVFKVKLLRLSYLKRNELAVF